MIFPAQTLLSESNHDTARIMFDANILIALLDRAHKNHEPVKQIIRHLYVCGAKLYYVQPCYLEILDYWRRKSLTEYLAIRVDSDDGLTGRFEKAYRYHLEELKKHTGTRSDAYFQDYVIKDLRDHLLRVGGKNQREVGRRLWQGLCLKAFAQRFQSAQEALKIFGIVYAKFNDDDVFPLDLKSQWPSWENMIGLIERFGLASNDAAILNMVACGKDINALMSNDYDMMIAAESGALGGNINCFTMLDW